MAKKLFFVLCALVVILLGALPLRSVSAQSSNCADGICRFPLTRWDPNYTANMKLMLRKMGDGSWIIPAGQTKSFNNTIGSLDGPEYYSIWIAEQNRSVPAAGACDVASFYYFTGLMNGLTGLPTKTGHPVIPGIDDPNDRVWIWNPGEDVSITNPFTHDITFRWRITDKDVLEMWIEGGNLKVTNLPVDSSSGGGQKVTRNNNGDANVTLPPNFDIRSIRWEVVLAIAVGAFLLAWLLGRRRKSEVTLAVVEKGEKKGFDFVRETLRGAIPFTLVYAGAAWLLISPQVKSKLSQELFGVNYGMDVLMAATVITLAVIWIATRNKQGEYYTVRRGEDLLVYQRERRGSSWRVKLLVLTVAALFTGISAGYFQYLRPQLVDLLQSSQSFAKAGADVKQTVQTLNSWGWGIDTTAIDTIATAPAKMTEAIQLADIVAGVLLGVAVVLLVATFISVKVLIAVVLLGGVVFAVGKDQIIALLLPPAQATATTTLTLPGNMAPAIKPSGKIKLSCDFNPIEAGLGPVQVSCDKNGYPSFPIRYWNGNYVTFYVDPEVFGAAEAASPNNLKLTLVSVSTAHSESPLYQNSVCSSAKACGTWQFIPTTFAAYGPPKATLDDRFSRPIEAVAAANLLGDGANGYPGMQLYAKTGTDFTNCFQGVGCPAWNMHAQQADYVLRLYNALEVSAGIK